MRAHRRQFVLGPEVFHAHDDWAARELAPGLWLSHCPTLPVGSAVDARGRRWTLLGRAVETGAERSDPLAAITAAPSEEVPRLREAWAGRWALIGEGALHLDAAGWLSAKEQLYDLGPPERFPILNAAWTHALLLGVAEERRRDSRIQEELIRRLAPELLEYPFNPSPKELGRVRSVLVKSRDDPLHAGRTAVRRLRRAVSSGRP